MEYYILAIAIVCIVGIGLLITVNNPIEDKRMTKELYFQSIIRAYKNSSLRLPWKVLYLSLLYIVGLVVLLVWNLILIPVKLTTIILYKKGEEDGN